MEKEALKNLRVFDLTEGIAGPYCTKLLSGFGAEVIKIERPDCGDISRTSGPFCSGRKEKEASVPFLWLNTGKMSVTLNLERGEGIAIAKRLAQRADILVESFPPGVISSSDMGYETLANLNPGLVMASITNFGQDGPYKNYEAEEIQLQALCGMMYLTGDPEKAPLVSGPALCQYSAGLHAYTAILMALFQRNLSGQGQYLDISIMECGLENIEIALTNYLQLGRKANRGPHLGVPWDLYPCKDGYGLVISMPARHWQRAAEFLDEPELFDKRYLHILDRIEHRQDYESLLKVHLKGHQKEALFHNGQSHGLAFGYLASLSEVLESPQHEQRKFFVKLDHPCTGNQDYCGPPFRMSKTPWRMTRAPLLGEHNEAVLGKILGYPKEDIERLGAEGVI
jgi:crotonobetainyl-CoA:carnitine CoA-transferase CaiB-like acyl-CoA transferase